MLQGILSTAEMTVDTETTEKVVVVMIFVVVEMIFVVVGTISVVDETISVEDETIFVADETIFVVETEILVEDETGGIRVSMRPISWSDLIQG